MSWHSYGEGRVGDFNISISNSPSVTAGRFNGTKRRASFFLNLAEAAISFRLGLEAEYTKPSPFRAPIPGPSLEIRRYGNDIVVA